MDLAGVIPKLDLPPVPHTHYDGENDATMVWNMQQLFDSSLQTTRNLPFPRDGQTPRQVTQLRRAWTIGLGLAILSECEELRDAEEAKNFDEETVDILHFITALAERLGMTPDDLGSFDERWVEMGDVTDPAVRQKLVLDMTMQVSQLIGAHFKWWKNHADVQTDWSQEIAALKQIDAINMAIAHVAFPNAAAMAQFYIGKNKENWERQQGTIAGREDYQSNA